MQYIMLDDDEGIRSLKSRCRRYRKKPVVIHALKMEVPFTVQTMEGAMTGKAGDFLVFGVRGEMYPVDAEIFDETYEEVRDK